jgi:hypothetical protein
VLVGYISKAESDATAMQDVLEGQLFDYTDAKFSIKWYIRLSGDPSNKPTDHHIWVTKE